MGVWRWLISFFILSSSLFALEKVSLQLKWHHQFQFAGYYAALEKGFYREEGLDVELKDRDLAQNNVEQVLQGKSHYGIADSVLFLYQARKEPIMIIAPIFQHSPNVLLTLKSSGIDSPYKLIGKRVAFYPNDADGLPILAMMHETGVLKKGFKRVNADFDFKEFINKKVDAHHGYITNEPYALLQKGVETNIINPQHFGVDLYGDIFFTSQNEFQKHPARVAAMKRATIRGWEYALSHQEEIIQLIKTKYAPEKTLDQLRYEAKGIESVISASTIPIGTLDYGRLEYTQNLLSRHGLINAKISLDKCIYKDAINNQLDLTPQERAWLKEHPIIRTAIDTSWAPFEYLDEKGSYQGLAADYLTLISQKLGVRFEPHTKGVWNDAVKLMEQHQLDMYPCAVKTPQREMYATFTHPYLNFRMVILTDENVGYLNGMNDLKNKTVAVARGYISEEILKRNYPSIKRVLVSTVAEGLDAVATGKAFAFIDNTAAISYAIKKEGYSNLKISGEIPYNSELSIGIRNDWPIFAGIMEKALLSITPEEREAIYNRHIHIEYTQQMSWERILKVVAPLGFIVALLLYYTRKLRTINRALHTAIDSLHTTQEELKILSTTDPLTALSNRYWLDETLKQAIQNASRYERALSVIIIDLDFFKGVNDTYGHHTGDAVLKAVATIFRQNCRSSDTVGRWGGEEFLIICPETDVSEAAILAEKLRTTLESKTIFDSYVQTASFGVCAYTKDDTPETLIIHADEALYASKSAGRNCVSVS
ncbi:diguanylate cyclase [Sulfuricurvum sp.]|uniref:transporter substrate-binding domain-containing diguanylate cyclase n=1 Tax=Sulfuricurvum sp. TaxID=2025608 RepID=UPI002E2FAB42|nr:diguanylate cyclase [Sulfuricurvum sp.]HEX5328720.1 diguanylate cyclase [Sulfuricurvum sp.]